MGTGRNLETPHRGGLAERMLRRLPSFRGKARIGRLLVGEEARTRQRLVEDVEGNLFQLPNLEEPVAFSMWLDGCYEPQLRDYLQSVCRPGSTFIDVGANIGVFTIPIARRVGPEGRVLAIEASAVVAGILRQNIALNHIENVEVCECAASDGSVATVEFFEAPLAKFGMGSRAPQFHAQPRTIPAVSIDDLVRRHGSTDVSAIKVDVEGFEAHVFLGAQHTLDTYRPPIAFEFSDWAEERAFPGRKGWAQEILLERGYSIWRLPAFQRGEPPLAAPLREGTETILAIKRSAAS